LAFGTFVFGSAIYVVRYWRLVMTADQGLDDFIDDLDREAVTTSATSNHQESSR
jgi:hypothetical protein